MWSLILLAMLNHGGNMAKKPDMFSRFTSAASSVLGRAWVFITALMFLALWAISGPVFGFSDTWQLIINTSTTIITFLMVFIIQNTQNRDNMAINIKLDSIMEKIEVTEQDLLEAEDMSDKLLEKRKEKMQRNGRSSNGKKKKARK
jgi:low affinity Fe/Cu permease